MDPNSYTDNGLVTEMQEPARTGDANIIDYPAGRVDPDIGVDQTGREENAGMSSFTLSEEDMGKFSTELDPAGRRDAAGREDPPGINEDPATGEEEEASEENAEEESHMEDDNDTADIHEEEEEADVEMAEADDLNAA